MTILRMLSAAALGTAIGCASTPTPLPDLPVPPPPSPKAAPGFTVNGMLEQMPTVPAPQFKDSEELPIDLPTVLRLVDANNPAIGFARARASEAQARLDKAELQWIPNLSVGAIYNHFDGQTQNQRGEVFSTSRGNLFTGSGLAVSLDFAEAVYRPLVERQQMASEGFRYQSAVLGSELDAVLAYFDLIQVHAQIAINADTIEKAESMLTAAKNAQAAKLDRTAGDTLRASVEVFQRKQERIELQGKAGAASARLARLLLIPESVKLVPADPVVVPVTLIDPQQSVQQLVSLGVQNHPQLAANRAAIAAAWQRVTLAKKSATLPKLGVADQVGSFGGGLNNDLQSFDARNVIAVQLFWELKNFGLGNRADVALQRSQVEQANYQLLESQARLVAEIVEAAHIAQSKARELNSYSQTEHAVKEAIELYRIAKEGTLNVVDAKNLFDALRPLQAIQTLNQARLNYLATVLDYNRAQYRLFTSLGHAPQCATDRQQ